MKRKIEISFITPVYNTDVQDLRNCLDSIYCQNISDYEIILINDGSNNNNTNSFCKQEAESNPFLTYVYQKNKGSAVARNKALDLAQGEYIFFLDDDDELAENFYTQFLKVKSPVYDVMIFDYSHWEPDSINLISLYEEKDFSNKKEILFQNVMFSPENLNSFFMGSVWAKCFSRTFLEQNNIRFLDKLRKSQDRMFMLNVIFSASKIIYKPVYSYKYRLSNIDSISHKYNPKMIEYYHNLYIEMTTFCRDNHLPEIDYKYLEYGIFIELVTLVVFHIENKATYSSKKKQYFHLKNKYDLQKKLKKINYSDCRKLKSKIKLMLFKSRFFLPIYLFYTEKNKSILRLQYKK